MKIYNVLLFLFVFTIFLTSIVSCSSSLNTTTGVITVTVPYPFEHHEDGTVDFLGYHIIDGVQGFLPSGTSQIQGIVGQTIRIFINRYDMFGITLIYDRTYIIPAPPPHLFISNLLFGTTHIIAAIRSVAALFLVPPLSLIISLIIVLSSLSVIYKSIK